MKLVTEKMVAKIAQKFPLYSQYGKKQETVCPLKFFCPYNGWRWYVTEIDEDHDTCFGIVSGFEVEFGYFSISELQSALLGGVIPAVERDRYWKPTKLGDINDARVKDFINNLFAD